MVALGLAILSWAGRHPPLPSLISGAFCLYLVWRVSRSVFRDGMHRRIDLGGRVSVTLREAPGQFFLHIALRLALVAFLLYCGVWLIRDCI
jgi:hypothetical protein